MKLLTALLALIRSADTLPRSEEHPYPRIFRPEINADPAFNSFLRKYEVTCEIDHYIANNSALQNLDQMLLSIIDIDPTDPSTNLSTFFRALVKRSDVQRANHDMIGIMIYRMVRKTLEVTGSIETALNEWRKAIKGKDEIRIDLSGLHFSKIYNEEMCAILNGLPNVTSVSFAGARFLEPADIKALDLKYVKTLDFTESSLTFSPLPVHCPALTSLILADNSIRQVPDNIDLMEGSINLNPRMPRLTTPMPGLLYVDYSRNPIKTVFEEAKEVFPNAELVFSASHCSDCLRLRHGFCSCYAKLPTGVCDGTCGLRGQVGCRCGYTKVVKFQDTNWALELDELNISAPFSFREKVIVCLRRLLYSRL